MDGPAGAVGRYRTHNRAAAAGAGLRHQGAAGEEEEEQPRPRAAHRRLRRPLHRVQGHDLAAQAADSGTLGFFGAPENSKKFEKIQIFSRKFRKISYLSGIFRDISRICGDL